MATKATAKASRKPDATSRMISPLLTAETRMAESAHEDTPNMNTIGIAVIKPGLRLRTSQMVAVSKVSDASS